jgi:nucleoside-diphosphate-sugar epimerase
MNDKIRDQGTANLIDAAIANDIKTFICQSITMIYGQQHGDLVSSGTPLPTKQVEMAASTIKMEMMLIDRLPGRYIIFRFGSFYSPDDFFTNFIIDNVSNGKMPMVGDGKYYMNWIHLDDAASALVFGVENQDKLRGRILNVTDQHPILYADMLNHLSKMLRHKSPFYLPAWIARLILGKNGYAVLTNSYRVGLEPLLENWKPVYKNFLSGISEILNENKNVGSKTTDQ